MIHFLCAAQAGISQMIATGKTWDEAYGAVIGTFALCGLLEVLLSFIPPKVRQAELRCAAGCAACQPLKRGVQACARRPGGTPHPTCPTLGTAGTRAKVLSLCCVLWPGGLSSHGGLCPAWELYVVQTVMFTSCPRTAARARVRAHAHKHTHTHKNTPLDLPASPSRTPRLPGAGGELVGGRRS